ncbi:MAG TPA: ABC transporter permease [Rhizomicrobium sp.]|jgi:ABC-2 type transport system permease protein|nr:ABC transporter permease [Rhizomicrobium sp.]
MNARRIGAVALRQFYLYTGSPTRVVPLFIWVGIDIVLWGFITRYLNRIASPGFNFVPALLGAVLLWDFLTRVMQGISTAFLEEVWSRNFLNLFATPLTISEYLAGLVITSIGTSLIGLATMLCLATLVFGLSFFAYGAAILPFLLVLFLSGIALGIAATAMMLRLGPASEWFVWPMPAMLSPFAGVFYPISTLPSWMQWVSRILPPSYVFEGMRAIVRGTLWNPATLAIGFALSVVYILAAGWLFERVFRVAVRTGLLARYSAESTT